MSRSTAERATETVTSTARRATAQCLRRLLGKIRIRALRMVLPRLYSTVTDVILNLPLEKSENICCSSSIVMRLPFSKITPVGW